MFLIGYLYSAIRNMKGLIIWSSICFKTNSNYNFKTRFFKKLMLLSSHSHYSIKKERFKMFFNLQK